MLTMFFIVALVYTSLEVCYWYFKWNNHLGREPMPIVRGLLFAVLFAHLMNLIGIGYEYFSISTWHDSASYGIMLLGAFAYMVPIWRQEIHRCTTPLSFFIRVAIISGVTTLGLHHAFIQ